MSGARVISTVKISAGTSLSDPVNLSGECLAGIIIPGNWTSADLTFRIGVGGGGLANLVSSSGAEQVFTVAPGEGYLVNPLDWAGAQYIQFRSGTSAAPVVQTQDVVLRIILWGTV